MDTIHFKCNQSILYTIKDAIHTFAIIFKLYPKYNPYIINLFHVFMNISRISKVCMVHFREETFYAINVKYIKQGCYFIQFEVFSVYLVTKNYSLTKFPSISVAPSLSITAVANCREKLKLFSLRRLPDTAFYWRNNNYISRITKPPIRITNLISYVSIVLFAYWLMFES